MKWSVPLHKPLGEFFQQFLHTVFPAALQPRGNGLLNTPGVVHFCGAHQGDVGGPATGALCGGGYFFLYLSEIFSYAQLRQNLSFVYIFSHQNPVALLQGARERIRRQPVKNRCLYI